MKLGNHRVGVLCHHSEFIISGDRYMDGQIAGSDLQQG
jgi:hypothetical protein